MNTSVLNLNQSPEELEALYGANDYYWYLRSSQFQDTFLRPIAKIVNRIGGSCLDVGCGEGQLGDFVTRHYVGFDGSTTAVARAGVARPTKDIRYGRFESPEEYVKGRFTTIVFGGVLEVLITPEQRVPLLERYRGLYCPSYFIVYDLERLDTTSLQQRYCLIEEIHKSVEGIDLLDAKKHRKIMVFKCN